MVWSMVSDPIRVVGMFVFLLVKSFAFAHAEDVLTSRRWTLPPRSRIMQTGGFKGRAREIDADSMRRQLCLRSSSSG